MTAFTNEEFMDRLWDAFVEAGTDLPSALLVYRDDETLAAAHSIEPHVAAKVTPMALAGFRADEVVFISDAYVWTGPDQDIPNGTPSDAFLAGDPHASEALMFQRCFRDGAYQAGHIAYLRDVDDNTKVVKTGTRLFKGPMLGRAAVNPEKMAMVADHWSVLYRATEALQLSSLAADMIAAKVLARDWGVEFTLYYSADGDEQREEAIAEAERVADQFSVNATVRALPDEAL